MYINYRKLTNLFDNITFLHIFMPWLKRLDDGEIKMVTVPYIFKKGKVGNSCCNVFVVRVFVDFFFADEIFGFSENGL